jgi:glycosyltransferase involved in cell wall biosynthesis
MSDQNARPVSTSELDDRPLVSFTLFAYNQEQYIREAVEGAFAQTYSPLEIILSDDCSTDRTFEIIEEMVQTYCGPHQIKTNRNRENLGLVDHVNGIFDLASGELIVAAAGDDVSLPERTACIVDTYNQGGRKSLLLHSSAIKIDEANNVLGILIPPVVEHKMSLAEMAICQAMYIGATGAWSRSIYCEFGPIAYKAAYEDLVFGFRAALKDSMVYIAKPLVKYRLGTGVSTQPSVSATNLAKRIRVRRNRLKTALDVNEQRLIDLGRVALNETRIILRARLLKEINQKRKQLLFYQNPFSLLFRIFSNDPVTAMRAFKYEVTYLIGAA